MKRAFGIFAHLTDRVLSHRHIIVLFSVVFLLTIAAALYFMYLSAERMREQISEDFNQQQHILARQAAARIDALLQGIAAEVHSIEAVDGALAGARPAAIKSALRRSASGGVRLIEVRSRAGELLASYWAEWAERHERSAPWPACTPRPAGGPPQIGPLVVDKDARGLPRVLTNLCMPIGADGAEVVAAEVDVSRLVHGVTGGIRSGHTGYAWVIDDTGMFLYHPERDFVGKSAFEARRERGPYVSFSAINAIMKERMVRGAEGLGTYVSGWHRGMHGEITKLIAYTPVQSPTLATGTAWSVAVVAPTSEVAQAVHRIYVRQVLAQVAVIACLFLFALTALAYQRRWSRTLKRRVGRQQEIISALLEGSEDAIIFIGVDNRVLVWSKGAEMAFGYTAEEMIGRTFHCLIPPEVDAEEELWRIQQEVNDKGHMRNHVATRVTKDGRRLTIDLSRTLVREPDGRIAGSIALIRDITEKMEVEQRIYSTEKLASIGILAAGVAHEINNPLAVILGFTDLMLEKTEEGTAEYEDLKIIEYNANHAKKVVEDMLGFARVTEGLEDTVDVTQSVGTVMNICKNTLMTKKIDVEYDVQESLPRVRGDTREFQQVLFNLINNAVAAMAGMEGGTLAVSTTVDQGHVHLSVTDTGVGIPESIQPRIFDPFFTTKSAGEGTGLGLSLCYGIVRKYGGKMSFVSASQDDYADRPNGTRFTVSMPIAEDGDSGKGAHG